MNAPALPLAAVALVVAATIGILVILFAPIPPALLGQLRAWDFGYLVVDRRMAVQVPEIRIYFETNEPIEHDGRPAFTLGQLTKFDGMPWTVKIYDSEHIAIYRFDFSSLGLPVAGVR